MKKNITTADIIAIRLTAGATKPLPKTPEERILDTSKHRLELSVVREVYTDNAIKDALTEKSVIEMMIEDVVLTGGTFEERQVVCGDTYDYAFRNELTEDLDPDFDGVYIFEDGTTLVVTSSEAFRVTPALKDKIIREYGITPVTV